MALNEEGIAQYEGLMSRWVRLASGVKVHYVTSGESGPVVVLLHGGAIGSSGTAGWRFQAPFLGENGFRVFCPDQPAFGLTEGFEDVYAPGAAGHVDFLHDFVTALCLDRFHLSGNSMGCINAVNYVVAHPERVISYILIAGGVGDLVSRAEIEKMDTRPFEERPRFDIYDGTRESMQTIMEVIIHRKAAIDPDLVEMRMRSANRLTEPYNRHLAALRNPGVDESARLSTRGRLDKLTIPAIYLFGRQDVLNPVETAYPQEDALPQMQFFYPDETGHQGQSDQPEMFNQVFLEFFRDGRVTRKTADWAGVSTRRAEISALVDQA